jgi:hypothetical protein
LLGLILLGYSFAANAASTSQIDLSVHRTIANQATKNRRTEKQKNIQPRKYWP